MAMIKCPKCNGEISDKASKCVHCGQELTENFKKICSECGNEIKENENICSNCGCPIDGKSDSEPQKVEVTKVKIGGNVSKKKIVIIIIVILLMIGIIVGEMNRTKQQYKMDLNSITVTMLAGSAKAETCGNKIKKVWYNSIWHKDDAETDKYTKTNGTFNDDFNASLSILFADSEFVELVDSVKDNQEEVNKFMKKMKNPPKEWEEAYIDLKEFYSEYLTFTNMCVNPNGSLQTYSTNFNNSDNSTVNAYEKVQSHLDY